MVAGASGSSDDPSMPTITQLIADHITATGRSYRDLAHASGDRVKHQTFQELKTGPPKSWPKSAETIRGIAQALGVTERAVVLAFARSLGVDVAGGSLFAQQLPPGVDDLSPKERKAAIEMLRVLVAQRQEIIAADFGSAGQLQADAEVVESPQRPVRRRQQPGPPVHPVDRDVERDPPTFDRSRMLAAMEEPEAAEPPAEPDVDAPSDDFEGR